MRIFPETLKRSETFRKFPKKRSETFRNFPIYRPSTRLLKLKNACLYDRSRKECTFTLCSYPDLFAHSRGMKYPELPASPGLMRHTSNIYSCNNKKMEWFRKGIEISVWKFPENFRSEISESFRVPSLFDTFPDNILEELHIVQMSAFCFKEIKNINW